MLLVCKPQYSLWQELNSAAVEEIKGTEFNEWDSYAPVKLYLEKREVSKLKSKTQRTISSVNNWPLVMIAY